MIKKKRINYFLLVLFSFFLINCISAGITLTHDNEPKSQSNISLLYDNSPVVSTTFNNFNINTNASLFNHNNLSGLQGGTAPNEFFHINESVYDNVTTNFLNWLTETTADANYIRRDGTNNFTDNFDTGAINFSVNTDTLFVDSSTDLVNISGSISVNPSGFNASEVYGFLASSTDEGATVVGYGAKAGEEGISIGLRAQCTGLRCISIGTDSSSSGSNAFCLGRNCRAAGTRGTGVGTNANIAAANGLGFGWGSAVTHDGASAYGVSVKSLGEDEISMGAAIDGDANVTTTWHLTGTTATQNFLTRPMFTLETVWLDSVVASRTSRIDMKVLSNAVSTTILSLEGTNNFAGIGTTTPTTELEVNGTTTTKDLNATGNVTVGDDLTVINAAYFGTNQEEVRTPLNPGDLGVDGRIFANNTIQIAPQKYGTSLFILNNGDDEPERSALFTGASATLNVNTGLFCDVVNNPFTINNATDLTLIHLFSAEFGVSTIPFRVLEFINSSCANVNLAIFGTDSVSNTTMNVYALINRPVFFVTDNGFISAAVGSSEDAQFLIEVPNATGSNKVLIESEISDNNTIIFGQQTDSKNFTGVEAIDNILFSSTGAENVDNHIYGMTIDTTKLNDSSLHFFDLIRIGNGNNNVVDGIVISGLIDDIIRTGSVDILNASFYNNQDITTDISAGGSGATVFELDDDYLYIGSLTNFTDVGISLSTPSSQNLLFVYYYCNSSNEWDILPGVIDTTDGFKNSGKIQFDNPDDRGDCNQQINGTPFSQTVNYTYIALQRTRNLVVTEPTILELTVGGASTNFLLKEDLIKLSPVSSPPETCNLNLEGAQYADDDIGLPCWCNGVNWVQMNDFTTVCS